MAEYTQREPARLLQVVAGKHRNARAGRWVPFDNTSIDILLSTSVEGRGAARVIVDAPIKTEKGQRREHQRSRTQRNPVALDAPMETAESKGPSGA